VGAGGNSPTRFVPDADVLERLAGIEESLRANRRLKRLGWLGLALALPLRFYLASAELSLPFATAFAVGVAGLGGMIVVATRYWLRASRRPLSYTCSIAPFVAINTSARDSLSDFANEIVHDLSELLHQRIGRLHFRDPDGDDTADKVSRSHIAIQGEYLIREDDEGVPTLEITPRIRVGSEKGPASLAHSVKYPLSKRQGETFTLSRAQHDDILEKTYFSVASHIYKEIREDIEKKIELLPTPYLRATAYLREAEDYASSNTVDAYEDGRELYDRAIRLYDPRQTELPSPKILRRPFQVLLQLQAAYRSVLAPAFAWVLPRMGRREVLTAQAEVGYASTLLYQRILAGLSGHKLNPIYAARPALESAIMRLTTLPSGIPERRKTLFRAHVSLALAWISFGSPRRAEQALKAARPLAPSALEKDPYYLYVSGVLQPDLRASLQALNRAVEHYPRFEVARFELAHRYEMDWRRNNIDRVVATYVIQKYRDVLTINPSNLKAWANIGYVYWLLGDLGDARAAYERGLEYKKIKWAVHVPDLDYGRARVEAEAGNVTQAYWFYRSGVDSQLAEGVPFLTSHSAQFHPFAFINDRIMSRYREYRDNLERALDRIKEEPTEDVTYRGGETRDAQSKDDAGQDLNAGADEHLDQATARVRSAVLAFVLNDLGEAAYTLYRRTGTKRALDEAEKSYRRASETNPDFVMPFYNGFLLQLGHGNIDEAIENLDKVRLIEPTWSDAIVARAYAFAHWLTTKPRPGSEQQQRADEVRAAIGDVANLVPHPWLWKRSHDDGRESARPNWRAVTNNHYRRLRKWEREMDDIHVTALMSWSLVMMALEKRTARGRLLPVTDGRRNRERGNLEYKPLLQHIRDRLWPSDFLVLLFFRRHFGDPQVDPDLEALVEMWLKRDPSAHWALTIALGEFKDRDGRPFELFDKARQEDFLKRALKAVDRRSSQRKWIKRRLRQYTSTIEADEVAATGGDVIPIHGR
jgi:tetratricopeptide (TPR) repeat protein